MFETVVPETVTRRSRRLLYETLPLSLALHAVAVGAGLAAAVWTVAFPQHSPRVTRAYALTRVPDPPPPPQLPQPRLKPAPQQAGKPAPPPPPPPLLQQLAPTQIPDLIPQVAEADPPPPPPPAIAEPPSPEASPRGVQGEHGPREGELGGKVRGVPGGIFFAEDGRVHVDRSVKLPLRTIEQVFPTYPEAARKARLEGDVLIRYVIGTDGRVKDVDILQPAIDKMFDEAAVNSIRQWRFRPMMRDGKPVEVVHEVEFHFEFFLR